MRIFIGALLLISFSFACDQKHEEVGGYKIGCPLNPATMPFDKGSDDANIRVLSDNLNNSFFESVIVKILNDDLEQASFSKKYQDITEMASDTRSVLKALSDKWGEYETMDLGDTKMHTFNNPKSDIINNIMVTEIFRGAQGIIGVTYISNKMADYNESVSEQKNKKKYEDLKGF